MRHNHKLNPRPPASFLATSTSAQRKTCDPRHKQHCFPPRTTHQYHQPTAGNREMWAQRPDCWVQIREKVSFGNSPDPKRSAWRWGRPSSPLRGPGSQGGSGWLGPRACARAVPGARLQPPAEPAGFGVAEALSQVTARVPPAAQRQAPGAKAPTFRLANSSGSLCTRDVTRHSIKLSGTLSPLGGKGGCPTWENPFHRQARWA